MTELRDARLRQALDQAPDATLQPPARVRDAIRSAAHGAVQPPWRRWWPRAGARSPSWMAALASVLVATLVVAIWQGQEVPGAREEPPLADRAAPAPVVAPAAAPAPSLAGASASAPAPMGHVTAPAAPAAAPRAPARREQTKPAVGARAAADALADRQRESSEGRVQEQAGAEAAARQEMAKAGPPPQPPAPAAPPQPPPAVAPAPAAAPALTARFAAPPPPAWTQVRIVSGERSVLVPRSQAEALPALVNRLLMAPREPSPLALPLGSLRLELEAQGVLEWSEQGWRLVPQGDPGRAQLLKADEATAAALRAEAEKLLNR